MYQIISFSSQKTLGLIHSDGTGECYPDLRKLIPTSRSPGSIKDSRVDPAKQASWQWGQVTPDGSGILVTSFEEIAIERVVLGDFRTRLWLLDFTTGDLAPVFEGARPSEYMTCAGVLPDGDGYILAVIIDGEQRLYRSEGDIRSGDVSYHPLTGPGEGFHYGVDVSPDGSALVCHVTGGKYAGKDGKPSHPPYPSYSIHQIDLADHRRTVLYGDDEHLYFAPVFSPDGNQVAFLDCTYRTDPAHFWADLCAVPALPQTDQDATACIAAPTLTSGGQHWFGTSHGPADRRGGGSNMTTWTPDGAHITFTRKAHDSHPDCFHDARRPDHQENVFAPERAKGGTQLCLLSPDSNQIVEVTEQVEGRWDFRVSPEQSTGANAFIRYRIGEPTELWICDAFGGNERRLTSGYSGHGADFPKWVPGELYDAVKTAI